MPGCAAVGCTNSSEKGFLMKHFPRDPKRRKEWTILTKRGSWFPTNYSVLCEAHFEPRMWEIVRVDGSRRLRSNAVPTIFPISRKPRKTSKRKKLADISGVINDSIPCTSSSAIVDSPAPTSHADIKNIIPSTSCVSVKVELSTENVEYTLPVVSPEVILMDHSYTNLTYTREMSTSQSSSEPSQLQSDTTPSCGDPSAVLLKIPREQELNLYGKYKNELSYANFKIKNLEKSVNDLENSTSQEAKILHKVFGKDQIAAFKNETKNVSTEFTNWSNETVMKALKLKFQCGTSGYAELLKQNLPYPSVRTLQRRLQNLKFDSGILNELFHFLKIKVDSLSDTDKDCTIVLDEMAITPGKVYDTSMCQYFGEVTFPEHSGDATHVLAFMLAGINSRWTQVVAYYFTSDTILGYVFQDIIISIFQKANEIGLNILSITSNMGAYNQAFWKTMDVAAGRHKKTKNFIKHPLDSSKKVYFIADVPRLFKNAKSMLLSNKLILMPKSIQDKYNLPTPTVCSQHINELVTYQEHFLFKLVPKPSQEDLLPTHYDKIKVSEAINVINHDVSSALKFIAKLENKPEYLTTAWFIDQIDRWFCLMTSRCPINAIGPLNEDAYAKTITFLYDFMEIVEAMQVGVKKLWKQSQTGLLISTKSILDLQAILLNERGYNCLLTGRFSQDCLENVSSMLESKQVTPDAIQVKNHLKMLCVAQYLRCPKSTSYEEDDREFLSDFISDIESCPEHEHDTIALPDNLIENVKLDYSELNSLHNSAGYS